ncbi:nuclear transport factor 2 family protein [Dyella sp. ASV21]|uniref:nuclear transport factor 2 family protein n=1 Tax=Dyella sp. ASV21 TaxID=2795114 RepID=UPI0018ED737D|nr:nuclear transport factor 2 family protein [Dyella sp. ASV21]
MKRVPSAVILLASLSMSAYAGPGDDKAHAADRVEIQHLVEHFKRAIVAKQGDALQAMFLPGASWFQGTAPTSLAAIRAKQPEAKAVAPGSYAQFARFVSSAPRPIEETFDNVRIDTDGIVGTVSFDYRFLVDGKATNHGMETWQVVRTAEGWKISAMLYSVTLDDING